ncbi:low-density lipoprotein receptor-related protein 4-like isoform X2 [Mizuhopecten yessoensis]|uniref:Low-density lipoprotein receptor-related protein 4 n=1 Tax=Mizuhopecten yessoensis TaxID=6573 RepID=A0A210PW54_MIZYE|nr:low-density lipoprotein receptor-related protein 4-like isoform X2 [Mizuhopecten yessoensis]OWF40727.1 Low-density lipoprotein receptor-related protein 4 [Mizuhopecten yessoensis]
MKILVAVVLLCTTFNEIRGFPCTCPPHLFSCGNCICIPERWACDGDNDCQNNYDEAHCVTGTTPTCPANHSPCDNDRCVSNDWICDGDNDCGDNSDELKCTMSTGSCDENEFRCDNGVCIPTGWRCDHDNDCGDNSDEKCLSEVMMCSSKQFACGDGSCIPQSWRCDKDPDCTDGADEKKCNREKLFCGKDEFKCLHSFTCIPKRKKCDLNNDCGNWEDEADCALFSECKDGEFRCNDTMCINQEWRCDGDIDCDDRSDEDNCSLSTVCETDEFRCDTGLCIQKRFHCDGNYDCPDNSDERGCANSKECGKKQFQCMNHDCIADKLVCNGVDDCNDNSDERNCNDGHTGDCGMAQFLCKNKNCIGSKKVCNFINDCGDNSDEEDCEFPGDCHVNNGDCEQFCISTTKGPHCSCKLGFQLKEDRHTCEDLNECSWEGTCSQICQNQPGSYTCQCVEGYKLKPDKRGCKARGGKAYLIFANRVDIRKLLPDQSEFDSILEGLPNAIALDFHHEKGLVFWSDIALDKIKRAYINGSQIRDVVKYGLESPGGIAVDWEHNLLFWADSGTSTIEVTDLEGKYRKVLIWNQMEKPRAIVVHPGQGSIFWTDWGSVPKIERGNMDGSERMVLANTSLFWPNGLTLDYATDKLYWADAKHHVIECSDLFGKNRRTVISRGLPHPFALTLFEDELYWTDWHTKSINKANKFTGNDVETIRNRLHFPMDIHTFHPQRQPMFENHCGRNNGGCSHLCLPNRQDYSCSCPTGQHLSKDRHTCIQSMENFLVFSTRSDLRRISMDTPDKTDVVIPLVNVVSAVGVDFDASLDMIYWTDTGTDTISRAHWDGSQEEVVVGNCLEFPTGLAVDWLGRKMYWTDSELDVIEVSNLNGTVRSILIWERLDQPRDIIVDPNKGFMYWTDWGKNAKIEKAGMDGKGRHALISSNLTWPNGLALDQKRNRIYWTDAGRKMIESATTEGLERQVIIAVDLPRPFGLALHNNQIYWTDWIDKGIHMASKFDGSGRQTLRSNLGHVMDVRMFHKPKQKRQTPCQVNNGGCSHLCLNNAEPQRYSCACPTGVVMKSDGKTCEDDMTNFLIFARRTDIRKISLEVEYFADVVIPLGELRNAIAVDVDSVRGKLYWTDTVLDKVMRGNLDGSQVEEVIRNGLDTPDGLAVDEVGGKIYWTDTGLNRIEVADIDGTMRKVLFWRNIDKPRAITLHYDAGFLYWTDWGKNPKIERADMDGQNRVTVVKDRLGWPNGLVIDRPTARLIWADARMEVIESTDLHGQNRRVLVSKINHPYGLTVSGNHLYWTDWLKMAIFQADKDSGQNQTIRRRNMSGLMDIHAVQLKRGGNGVVNKCGKNNGGCSHLCLPNPRGFSCACPTGLLMMENGKTCNAMPNKYLLFASRGSIRHISLDTTDLTDVYLPMKDLHNVIALDYDKHDSKMYYTDVHLDVIRRSNLDGTESETIVSKNLETTDGLAVDWIGRNLFWTDTGRDVIEVAWLDGTYRKKLIYKNLDEPRAIALFPSKGLIYWTDWGAEPKIEKAFMDGTNRSVIIRSSLGFPNGLSIDYSANRLYWVDAKLDKIETSDLAGGNRVTLIQHISHPFGLVVYGDHIYWTDWQTELIEKASKYTGKNREVIQQSLEGLMDIEVVADDRQTGENGCSDNNGGCTHLCLANPYGYTCACPDKKGSIACLMYPVNIHVKPDTDPHVTKPPAESCSDDDVTRGLCDHDHKQTPLETATSPAVSVSSIWVILVVGVVIVLVAIMVIVVAGHIYKRRKRRAYNVDNGEFLALNFANPTYQKTSTETINSVSSTSSRLWRIFRFNKHRDQVQFLESSHENGLNNSETCILVRHREGGGHVSQPMAMSVNRSLFKAKSSNQCKEQKANVPYLPVDT